MHIKTVLTDIWDVICEFKILIIILLFVGGIMVLAQHRTDEIRGLCEAKNGHFAQMKGYYLCLKKDAIIEIK